MLDTYIKVTTKIVSWLLYLLMNMLGPVFKIVCLFMAIGGAIAALLLLGFYDFDKTIAINKDHMAITYGRMFWTYLVVAFAGMAGIVVYELKMDSMYLDLLFPMNEEAEETSRGAQFLNWTGTIGLLIAFCLAVHFYYYNKMFVFEWPVVGFALWVAVGFSLGACRWIYRQSRNGFEVVSEVFQESHAASANWFKRVRLVARPSKGADVTTCPEPKVIAFRRKA